MVHFWLASFSGCLLAAAATRLEWQSDDDGLNSSEQEGVALRNADGLVPSDYPPYYPQEITLVDRLQYCNFGGMRIFPSNALQLQQHGAKIFATKNKCSWDDWLDCSSRSEETCAGTTANENVSCRWVANSAEAAEIYGPGSCIFSCYPSYASSQGIPIFQSTMSKYDGLYADLTNFPDTLDQFVCLKASSGGEAACAATTDSTGHPCVPCKVPSDWYGMTGSVPSDTEGLDFWCVNNRGFERYCDFLREPAFLCSNIKEAEYPVDYEGPTIAPTTTTTTKSTASTESTASTTTTTTKTTQSVTTSATNNSAATNATTKSTTNSTTNSATSATPAPTTSSTVGESTESTAPGTDSAALTAPVLFSLFAGLFATWLL